MRQAPIQMLEVRAGDIEPSVTITFTIAADASRAIFIALSEELDRRRGQSITSAEELLALRANVALIERFDPLADAGALICFSDSDLRACLLELTNYANRVDGEHYQALDLRERLRLIAQIAPILWDANATAAGVAVAQPEPLARVAS